MRALKRAFLSCERKVNLDLSNKDIVKRRVFFTILLKIKERKKTSSPGLFGLLK